MIKNNFILSESEKNRVLTLHRLPNHKPSYRLNEQTIKVTWQGDEKKKDEESTDNSAELESNKKLGGFRLLNFSNSTVVGGIYNNVVDMILKNYRGEVFKYFYKALVYADKVYSGNGYGKLAIDLKTLSDTRTAEVKIKIKDELYDTFSDPANDDLPLYSPTPLEYFGGRKIYQYKRLVSAEIRTGEDKTAETKSSLQDAQNRVIKNMNTGFLGDMTNDLCIDTLQFYLNRVISSQYPVSGEQLRKLKRTIAYCNTNTEYNPAREKGIFNKIKNKTSGNVYGQLNKKTKEMLTALQYRNDDFKTDINNPNNN